MSHKESHFKVPENPTQTIQSWLATVLPVGRRTDQSKAISQPIRPQPQRLRCSGIQTVILQPDLSTSTQPPQTHRPCISLPFSSFLAISSCQLLVLRASPEIIFPNNYLSYIIAT
ncbi:hypothetical protein O181_024899 [Austropuccinia psidii MF-1]|uniref:Uncharacterized protein n=1 Tax=Austropuccinia psidii MF-1 TaxID=1389203 RepID=A0A9Q3H044_9BASI|nr:hypothetical protein [Austropuccinia psidii MF-1]